MKPLVVPLDAVWREAAVTLQGNINEVSIRLAAVEDGLIDSKFDRHILDTHGTMMERQRERIEALEHEVSRLRWVISVLREPDTHNWSA